MIAVTFALPSESSDFRRLLGPQQRDLAILHTGVGEKSCRRSLSAFLDRQPCALLISSGFAGGVDPSLGAGELFLASNFSHPALLAGAQELLFAHAARLATVDRVLAGAADRARFAREQEAAAVDMETAWIAAACRERKIPLLSLRVISDTAAAPFPAPPDVLFDVERQRVPALRLFSYLLRNPSAIPRLTRFARQIAAARRTLASALEMVIREIDVESLK